MHKIASINELRSFSLRYFRATTRVAPTAAFKTQ
jgi:hypothetical protein